jgi:hypothetical protein
MYNVFLSSTLNSVNNIQKRPLNRNSSKTTPGKLAFNRLTNIELFNGVRDFPLSAELAITIMIGIKPTVI